jgi:hypothetical protein
MKSNTSDIVKAADRYDKLQAEYDEYTKKCGSLKSHSQEYLLRMMIDIRIHINHLHNEPEDMYQSVGSALVRWTDLRDRVIKEIKSR